MSAGCSPRLIRRASRESHRSRPSHSRVWIAGPRIDFAVIHWSNYMLFVDIRMIGHRSADGNHSTGRLHLRDIGGMARACPASADSADRGDGPREIMRVACDQPEQADQGSPGPPAHSRGPRMAAPFGIYIPGSGGRVAGWLRDCAGDRVLDALCSGSESLPATTLRTDGRPPLHDKLRSTVVRRQQITAYRDRVVDPRTSRPWKR
jgi:hypothetical protein